MLPGAITEDSMLRDFVLYFIVFAGALAAVAAMVINTGQLGGWW